MNVLLPRWRSVYAMQAKCPSHQCSHKSDFHLLSKLCSLRCRLTRCLNQWDCWSTCLQHLQGKHHRCHDQHHVLEAAVVCLCYTPILQVTQSTPGQLMYGVSMLRIWARTAVFFADKLNALSWHVWRVTQLG